MGKDVLGRFSVLRKLVLPSDLASAVLMVACFRGSLILEVAMVSGRGKGVYEKRPAGVSGGPFGGQGLCDDGLFVLENRLCPEDEAVGGAEVVGLGVDFASHALDVDDGGAPAAVVVCPKVASSVAFFAELGELAVGGVVEVFGECFGLDGAHDVDEFAEGLLVVTLAGAGELSGHAALVESDGLVGDDFGGADAVVGEAECVPAWGDPCFEVVFAVLDEGAAFDLEEFGVDRTPIEDQLVCLEAG